MGGENEVHLPMDFPNCFTISFLAACAMRSCNPSPEGMSARLCGHRIDECRSDDERWQKPARQQARQDTPRICARRSTSSYRGRLPDAGWSKDGTAATDRPAYWHPMLDCRCLIRRDVEIGHVARHRHVVTRGLSRLIVVAGPTYRCASRVGVTNNDEAEGISNGWAGSINDIFCRREVGCDEKERGTCCASSLGNATRLGQHTYACGTR